MSNREVLTRVKCGVCRGGGQVVNPVWVQFFDDHPDHASMSEVAIRQWLEEHGQVGHYGHRSDDGLPSYYVDCPNCNGMSNRLISQSSFILKGTGWYVTDYARKDGSSSPAKSEIKSEEPKKTESKTSDTKSSETKTTKSDTKTSATTKTTT